MRADLPNEIAALPPWLAGHEMADDDVAILTFAPDGDTMQVAASAVLPVNEINPQEYDETARVLAQHLSAATSDSAPAVFIVGHGPNGFDHAERMMRAIDPELPTGSAVIGLHNDGETVSARTLTRPWLSVGPPADVSAEMTAQGVPQPTASREMSDRMWEPDPVPSYPPLPAHERAALNAAPPSKRAAAAVELLTDLAEGKAQDVPLTQSRVAGLMSSPSQGWIQDHVMMTAATAETPALADELRRLYVEAPPRDQQSIIGPAALSAFTQHATTQPLRAAREHIDENGPSGHALPLINAIAGSGTNPKELQASLRNVHQRLFDDGVPAQRDSAWQEARSQGPGPATKNPTPPPPGPEDMPPGQDFSGPSMS